MLDLIDNYQSEFVDFVTKISVETKIPSSLLKIMDGSSSHRLSVYQRSFRGRAISLLAECVLSPLCVLYGENIVKEVVARYFSNFPPQDSCMIHALKDLPNFVRKNTIDWYSCFFSEMTRLCLGYSEFMVSENTLKYYFFEGKMNADFFSAWVGNSKDKLDIDCFKTEDETDSQHILFLRLSENNISYQKISNSLKKFIKYFIIYNSFALAIENLDENDIENIDADELKELVEILLSSPGTPEGATEGSCAI